MKLIITLYDSSNSMINQIDYPYIISSIDDNRKYIDTVYAYQESNSNLITKLVIINGRWQAFGFQTLHDIYFNKEDK